MTPQDVNTLARRKYNSVGDEFFSDAELYSYIWTAQMELAREAWVIERTYQATTVASQEEYSYPTNTLAIKRVTYNGLRLEPIDFDEYDDLRGNTTTTTVTGMPSHYLVWNNTISLFPIPDAAQTLKIYSFNEPQEVTSSSTLEVPAVYHQALADYLVWQKAMKDKNFEAAGKYEEIWTKTVQAAKRQQRIRLRGSRLAIVKDIDHMNLVKIAGYI
jgi:hypothetical protein